MVVAVGTPVNIVVYGDQGNAGILITCIGSGRRDMPPLVTGEWHETVILGAFNLDAKNTDPTSKEKVKELVRESFGDQVVNRTMLTIEITTRGMGFPLA